MDIVKRVAVGIALHKHMLDAHRHEQPRAYLKQVSIVCKLCPRFRSYCVDRLAAR